MRSLVAAEVCGLFNAEVEHLWAVFPAHKRSLDRYRELLGILVAQTPDVAWYAAYPRYASPREILADTSLCCFERLRSDFEVKFQYVRYYAHPLMRVPNALRLRYRRVTNHPGRYTQGLSLTRSTRAIAALVNTICEQIQADRPRAAPRILLVNSILRSQQEQQALARIGYIAPRTSSHLNGYAVDIEQTWYRIHDPDTYRAIAGVLDGLFGRHEINLIDEGTHWHICLNPAYIGQYDAALQRWMEQA